MNYEDVIKKQKNIIVVSVAVLVIVVIGASYALFLDVKEATSTQTITTGTSTSNAKTVTFTWDDEEDDASATSTTSTAKKARSASNAATLSTKNIPLSDEEGMLTKGYSFSYENTGTTGLKYYIALVNNGSTLGLNHIKVSISTGGYFDDNNTYMGATWSEPKLLSELETDSEGRVIIAKDLYVNADTSLESDDYYAIHNLKLWIDDDTPTTEIGKTISFSIYISGEAA